MAHEIYPAGVSDKDVQEYKSELRTMVAETLTDHFMKLSKKGIAWRRNLAKKEILRRMR